MPFLESFLLAVFTGLNLELYVAFRNLVLRRGKVGGLEGLIWLGHLRICLIPIASQRALDCLANDLFLAWLGLFLLDDNVN